MTNTINCVRDKNNDVLVKKAKKDISKNKKNIDYQSKVFALLGSEVRFRIVYLLLNNKELCVCDLTEKLQLSQPKISRHLALLRASGLLQDRRQGQWVYYSINPKLANWCYEILDILKTVQSQSKLDDQHPLSVNSYCE